MKIPAIQIRRAQADDAAFLAQVMLSASRGRLPKGIWDLRIGAGECACLDYLRRLALAEPPSLCHYSAFFIASVGDHPASALCGFDPRGGAWSLVAEAMANVQRDLNWSQAELDASNQRLAPIWQCFLPDTGADWGIEFVATLPEYRRRGLAGLLLDQVLREGVARGSKLAQLVTFLGNDAAVSVYLRAGFRIADEKRCDALLAALNAPGFVRLTRTL
jgi:ribosomal protein S18 acetylase RimI-like enzyme